jgi:hypothetical protein
LITTNLLTSPANNLNLIMKYIALNVLLIAVLGLQSAQAWSYGRCAFWARVL